LAKSRAVYVVVKPISSILTLRASFLIGEATHGPIPPFTTDPATPNWLLVGTTFDTNAFDQTKNGDVYLAFWVVV
jgi:hypothetical protein